MGRSLVIAKLNNNMVSITRTKQITNVGNEQAILKLFGAAPSYSGETVDSESVYGIPAFLNGSKLISQSTARIPCHILSLGENNSRDKAYEHPAYSLLNYKANPFQTSFVVRQAIVNNAIWSGNGYGLIERVGIDPVAIYPLDSRNVYVIYEQDQQGKLTGLYYGVNAGEQVVIPADDMIHVRNLALHNGIEGLSIVDALKQTLGLQIAITKFKAVYYKQGSHINRVLKIPGWLTEEQAEQLRNAMASLHQGVSQAHRLAILMGGADLQTLPVSAEEMELAASAELGLNDIAGILSIPVSLLGGRNSISYGSLEQDQLFLLSYTLDPWLVNLETEFATKLLKPSERYNYMVEHERKALLRADTTAEINNLVTQYNQGLLSWEEVRVYLNKKSTVDKGTFKGLDKPEPKEQPKEDPEPKDPDPTLERAIRITELTLNRIKTRLIKSNKPLTEQVEVIRESLPDFVDQILAELDTEELREVLPEQRAEVYNKWNTAKLAKRLWKS